MLVEEEAQVAAIVRELHSIAVIGMKDERDPEKAAYEIPQLLQRLGAKLYPVNPHIEKSLGEPAVARIADVPVRVDCVDVFRRIDAIPALADEILALPAERRPAGVWLQSGIYHDDAARKLSDAGLWVVQDRCLGVYARRYGLRKAG